MGQFSTRDIYLAASLLSYGERIADVNNADPQHQVFIFDGDTQRLKQMQTEYLNSRLHVEVTGYRDALIKLKNIVHLNRF